MDSDMFQIPQPANRRRRAALVFSLIVHCVIVFLWLTRAPLFVQPSSVAWGLHGTSTNLIYFPRVAEPTKTAVVYVVAEHKAVDDAQQAANGSAALAFTATMLAPAGTAAVLMTAPTPVITEHPMSAARSSGTSRSMWMADDSGTTVDEAYVATWP